MTRIEISSGWVFFAPPIPIAMPDQSREIHLTEQTLFQDIVLGVMERLADLDPMIASTLAEDWRLERMESVVRAILRAAVFELSHDTAVPTPVVINEYIEITKAFCSPSEVAFVNASLDALAKLLRTVDMQE